ncbi:MAG TPA: hypothetical protein VM912_19805 [Terriglobales bacterium]|nr:hypothetical protein [Terriglobales bacterium]
MKKGLYDQLITRSVRDALEEQNGPGVNASIDELEESDGPDYLARHLARQIKTALRGLSGEERKRRQIGLANSLLGFIQDRADSLETDVIEDPGKILRSVYSGPVPPLGPTTPLSATNLLMNAVGEPRLGFAERYAKLGRKHPARTGNTARGIWKMMQSEQSEDAYNLPAGMYANCTSE